MHCILPYFLRIAVMDRLEVADRSNLSDADWSEIKKLQRAYKEGGDLAVSIELAKLGNADPSRFIAVAGAFFPEAVREALEDGLAEQGLTVADLRAIIRNLERPAPG
jgi:hypothetical protein